MRIALFTPLLPTRTALADIIEGYLPHLAELVELTVVTTGDYQPTNPLFIEGHIPYIPVISYRQFVVRKNDFDLIVYNLGDEPNIHGYMFDALQEYPGVILLHDLVLHHAIFQRTWAQGKLEAYLAELTYSYGQELAESIVQQVRDGRYDMVANQYPLVERVLDNSLAVVGFNPHLVARVRELCPDLPTSELHYPCYMPSALSGGVDRNVLRSELGFGEHLVLASFGLFNTQKRLEITLRAIQRLTKSYPQVVFVMVGTELDPNLTAHLADLGLTDHIITTGWLDPSEFVRYMFAVDIAIQLRYPHVGGTPYTPIRLLGLGIPTIISDIEPQADIPSDAVIRIKPNTADEEAALYNALEHLITHPEQRARIGEAGQVYIRSHYDASKQAAELYSFLETVHSQLKDLKHRAVNRTRGGSSNLHPASSLVFQAGKALAEMGVYSTDTELLRAVADAIFDLYPPDTE